MEWEAARITAAIILLPLLVMLLISVATKR